MRINYKDSNLTREERIQLTKDVRDLRPHLNWLKERELGELKCEECSSKEKLEYHHKRYALDVTYYDLCLLCENCHKRVTDFRPINAR
jgi:hypothetical protein